MKRIVCHNAVATHFVRHTVTDAMEQWYWVTRVREQSTDFGNSCSDETPPASHALVGLGELILLLRVQ